MYTFAVLTISDKGFAGERIDESGAEIIRILQDAGYTLAHYAVLPDEQEMIATALAHLCDNEIATLVLTTGGTGFSQRDVTPEATLSVAERLCPGIPEAMRAYSLAITKRAMLTRSVAGIRRNSLIINLPGSKKAVRECLACLEGALEHGLDILAGQARECGTEEVRHC